MSFDENRATQVERTILFLTFFAFISGVCLYNKLSSDVNVFDRKKLPLSAALPFGE